MVNSKQKGKRGELELANELKRWGYEARRGQQYCGANGDADVVGLPWLYLECKRQEKTQLALWMNQAVLDAGECEIPVIVHRRSRGRWMVTMELPEFLFVYGFLNSHFAGRDRESFKHQLKVHLDGYGVE